jgi:hypothetical protein
MRLTLSTYKFLVLGYDQRLGTGESEVLNHFGQRLAEAMFDVGINSYSTLLVCLGEAGADPREASVGTLVKALECTKVEARPAFSPDFWRVLFSPRVLDLSEDKSKALLLAYATSEAEAPRV